MTQGVCRLESREWSAADAAGETGPAFALVYAAFLALMTWQWNEVRRQEGTGRYRAGMVVSIGAIVASAFLPSDGRVVV